MYNIYIYIYIYIYILHKIAPRTEIWRVFLMKRSFDVELPNLTLQNRYLIYNLKILYNYNVI